MKIAPTLREFATTWADEDDPVDRRIQAELRALLAVARAAKRCDEINGSQPGPRDAALRRALARLDKVSK